MISDVPPSIEFARAQEQLARRAGRAVEERFARAAERVVVVDDARRSERVDAPLVHRLVERGERELGDGSFGSGVSGALSARRMLVRRSTSASHHSFMSWSRRGGVVGRVVPRVDRFRDRAAAALRAAGTRADRRCARSSAWSSRRANRRRRRRCGRRRGSASVRYTSLNSASPVIWRSGRTSTPGACMSTMK